MLSAMKYKGVTQGTMPNVAGAGKIITCRILWEPSKWRVTGWWPGAKLTIYNTVASLLTFVSFAEI